MPTLLNRNLYNAMIIGAGDLPGLITSFALDSIYVGSDTVSARAGKAIAVRFTAPATTTVTNFFFFVSTIAGTPGNLTVELRDFGTALGIPGNLVTNGSVTVSPGATGNKWIKATFSTPPSVTLGNVYWLVIGDAGWVTSNTTSILSRSGGTSMHGQIGEAFRVLTSTDGFLSAGANVSIPGAMAIKFGDGTYMGNILTGATTSWASNQSERGFKISGLTESLVVSGLHMSINSPAGITTLKCYQGSTVPGGTIFAGFNGGAAFTISVGAKAAGMVMFAPVTLSKNTVYRFVFGYNANTVKPDYYECEDAATYIADLKELMPWGGTFCATIDNGSSVWLDYDNATNGMRVPRMGLLIKDQVEIPGGGAPGVGSRLVRTA